MVVEAHRGAALRREDRALFNFFVKGMTTAAHRSIELLAGLGMVGYCAYSVYQGRIFGRLRFYTRRDEPWLFWTTIIIALSVGIVFLSGHVSWRD
jgi:hypothetical protein